MYLTPRYFYLFMRWLLRADLPAEERTPEDMAAEVERNFNWNFIVNVLDGATFWFGISFISATTIVPLFISRLTDSSLPVGLAQSIAQGSWFLPQLFTANVVERLARKKPVVVNLGLFLERVPMWLIVAAALIAGRSPELALILFLFGYAWHGLGAGIIATAWQDLLAKCFPVERRGRMLGLTMFVGAATGVLGTRLSTSLLEAHPFPLNFTYVLTIAAIGITVSWFFLALTREPVQATAAPRKSTQQFWASLPEIVRRDHNFRRFLTGRMLLSLGAMGSGFIILAGVERWQLPDQIAGVYTMALLVGQTSSNLTFGLLADRFGHKLSLELCALAAAAAFVLAWLAPQPEWYYLVFALIGITQGAIIVSGILVVLEFCPSTRRPTYTGLANTAVGLVSIAAPLFGSGLADVDYGLLFAVCAAVNLVSFAVLRWWVKEPRWATVEA
jgi:MFS family permease